MNQDSSKGASEQNGLGFDQIRLALQAASAHHMNSQMSIQSASIKEGTPRIGSKVGCLESIANGFGIYCMIGFAKSDGWIVDKIGFIHKG